MLRVEKAVACIISLSILALGQIAWAQDQAIEPMTLVPGADYSETVMPGQAPMRHENVGLGLYPGMIISLNYETGNQRRSVSEGFISPRE